MNKEIEEMAKFLELLYRNGKIHYVAKTWQDIADQTAEAIYHAGYRKIPKRILANKTYSDSTLKSWTKEQLIEEIRILQHNWNAAEESLNIQSKAFEKLLEEQKKETAEILNSISELGSCTNNCDITWFVKTVTRKLRDEYGVYV